MKSHFLIRVQRIFIGNEPWWLIFHSEWEIIEECGSVLSACLMRVTLPSACFRRALSCQTTNSDVKCIFHEEKQ